MDPALIELTEAGPDYEEVSLILRLQDGVEPPPTVRVVARFGPIITVRCRRADILPTWASDRVISVKARADAQLSEPHELEPLKHPEVRPRHGSACVGDP